MKIALETLKGIAVLSVTETLTEHDIEVLRAGLVKIFKTGKNKIILELPKNDSLPSEVIRELATFDIMARELAGRLVLAGITAILKTKIEVFAMPPVILTFESREKAVEFFSAPPEKESPVVPANIANSNEATETLKEALHNEQNSFKTRIHELEQENKLLKEQIVLATIARRPPSDEAGYLEKIASLEAKIAKMLEATPPPAPITPTT